MSQGPFGGGLFIVAGSQVLAREASVLLSQTPPCTDRVDATYYDRIKLGEAVAAGLSELAGRDAKRIAARLEPLAVDARQRPPSHERMVLHEAFLVRRSNLDRFDAEASKLEAGGRFQVRLIGPMPPYSFVDLEVQPARRRRRSWAS